MTSSTATTIRLAVCRVCGNERWLDSYEAARDWEDGRTCTDPLGTREDGTVVWPDDADAEDYEL